MEKRLELFLKAKNISQSKFADTINVARASVSHILSGRNKPGFDFIENMSRQYPDLSLEWLITGKGEMFKNSHDADFRRFPDANENNERKSASASDELFPAGLELPENQDFRLPLQATSAQKPKISKVLVFYDNGTFREII